MKKIIFIMLVSLMHEPLLAYEPEDYVSSLQWQEKWDKVVVKATDGFVDRGKAYYPSSYTKSQTEKAAELIRSSIVQKIGWGAMEDIVVSGFRRNCGDELLDKMVEMYAGVEFEAEDRQLIAASYSECATASMRNAMDVVYKKISDFAEQEKEILSKVKSD